MNLRSDRGCIHNRLVKWKGIALKLNWFWNWSSFKSWIRFRYSSSHCVPQTTITTYTQSIIMPLYEAKPSHCQWRPHWSISKYSVCNLCLIVLAWCKGIYNEFAIGWSRCQQGVIAIESDWSDWIRLVMISYCRLNPLLTNVYNSNTCVIAAESDERALWREGYISDRDTLRTYFHLLNDGPIAWFC